MKADPQKLWTDFKAAFGEALNEKSPQELAEMWKAVGLKTSFYEQRLMPAVAERLGLKLAIEHQRIDHTLVDDAGVPLIAVEVENAHTTAAHEIRCLCCLATPLKVLILSCDWKASEKKRYLPEWIQIIQRHHAVVSTECLYGIVVGEWGSDADAPLEYSFLLLDPTGDEVGPEEFVVRH